MVTQEKSKVIRETDNPFEDEEEAAPSSSRRTPSMSAAPATQPTPSKDKDKKKGKKPRKIKKFDFEAEKDNMKAHIADAAMTSVNLTNLLQSINREQERISENPTAVKLFENCKLLRKNIIRYVCHVVVRERRYPANRQLSRSTTWSRKNGLGACSTLTTRLSQL